MCAARKIRAPRADAPLMTDEQMRRQDATVRLLKEAVAAQERRVRAWLQARLTVVPARAARAAPDPDAD